MEHSLRFEELNLTKETVYIEMGYGAVSPDKNVRDLVDNLFLVANNIVRPRFYFRMFNGYVNKDCICCNQKIFHVNQTIATLLKNSERFVFSLRPPVWNIKTFTINYRMQTMHCYYSSGIPSVVALPKRQETLWKSSWKQNCREYPILTVLVRVIAGGM